MSTVDDREGTKSDYLDALAAAELRANLPLPSTVARSLSVRQRMILAVASKGKDGLRYVNNDEDAAAFIALGICEAPGEGRFGSLPGRPLQRLYLGNYGMRVRSVCVHWLQD